MEVNFNNVCFFDCETTGLPHGKLFPGKEFGAHDAMEDVKAVMRCYKALIEMRIIDEPVPEPMITDDVYLELIKMHQEKDF